MFLTLRRWIAYAIWGTHAGAGKLGLRSASDTSLILRGDGVLVLAASLAPAEGAGLLPPDVIRSDWFEPSGLDFAMGTQPLSRRRSPHPSVRPWRGRWHTPSSPLSPGAVLYQPSCGIAHMQPLGDSQSHAGIRAPGAVAADLPPQNVDTLRLPLFSKQVTANQDAGRT